MPKDKNIGREILGYVLETDLNNIYVASLTAYNSRGAAEQAQNLEQAAGKTYVVKIEIVGEA